MAIIKTLFSLHCCIVPFLSRIKSVWINFWSIFWVYTLKIPEKFFSVFRVCKMLTLASDGLKYRYFWKTKMSFSLLNQYLSPSAEFYLSYSLRIKIPVHFKSSLLMTENVIINSLAQQWPSRTSFPFNLPEKCEYHD